ncbi:biotin--[acetyl-CoA-carboxylase] ligase [Pelotalea chapellei]|uniref:Bifunctional ligase/repressor BirA n=1 Tax=Pelotalea chapellei TaxID=44671 RepID=A0ABS5UCZ0_9BACT|nr:biotin--[acetyl-CoA-carboxylase] ligase [Pelotalea chapellei]MBT1073537.1 biotin--[acetyl-CoA-carboxylase] ligase [Pelotalea chapellei]
MHPKTHAILNLFHQREGFVSGEALSRELAVSRTAIWKHIKTLREAGYVIEAIPSRGYQLTATPDNLSAEEIERHLSSAIIGRRLICLAETTSTNSDAFRLAEQGAPEGAVVFADTQSGGKGRMGRRWVSPPGVNLYCSVILRPEIMPYEAPQLTFLSAVAVARAIELTTPIIPEIKWPNDVLVRGRKIAGLLNEMSAETDGTNFVILGMGINLNMAANQFPSDMRYPATSLCLELGRAVERVPFAATLLNELDRLYNEFQVYGFRPVREEWQQRCNAYGRELTVSDGDCEITRGAFEGIDDDGALLVRSRKGLERILSGDVRIL